MKKVFRIIIVLTFLLLFGNNVSSAVNTKENLKALLNGPDDITSLIILQKSEVELETEAGSEINRYERLSFMEKLLKKSENFIEGGTNGDTIDIDKASIPIVTMGQILSSIAVIVIIIITLIMGIKYMVAVPDKKATLKKQLMGLVISSIVIFGTHTIWSIIIKIMEDVTNVE